MLASLLLVTTAIQVPLASSLLFTCNPKQLARLSMLLASFTTTMSSSSLSCAHEYQVGNELYRISLLSFCCMAIGAYYTTNSKIRETKWQFASCKPT